MSSRVRSRPPLLLPGLALNVLIASGTFLIAKQTLREIPPLPLTLLRFLVAAGALWAFARALQPDVRVERRDRGRLLLLGILAAPLNQGLFLFGMQWASASHAALLYALTPAFVLLFLAWGGQGRPTRAQLAGIALAFAGVLTLLLQRGLRFDRDALRGDLLVFAAVIAWGLYLALARGMIRKYGPLVVTSEALLMGTLAFVPFGILGLRGFDASAVSLPGWLGLLYLGLLTSAVNYVLLFWGLEYLKPATVALTTNLQPLVTAAMAWVFLGERLPGAFALSTALVLGGVWLTQMGALRRAARPARA
jgi:drug/metabolite transporter (DMT)-like permease